MDKAYQDEIALDSGLTLFLDPSWNPEWNSTVTGKAELVPSSLSKKISKGDEVLFYFDL
jgi:hypothetical protein